MEFKKEIVFEPAFDKRHSDPSKNYGIHGVTLRFFLTGEKGTVQFVVYTHWNLKKVQEELDSKPEHDPRYKHLYCHPMPADLGYHSPIPLYDDQTIAQKDCQWTKGPCYYDGSTLNAEPVYWKLVEEGHQAVWKELESYYESRFS